MTRSFNISVSLQIVSVSRSNSTITIKDMKQYEAVITVIRNNVDNNEILINGIDNVDNETNNKDDEKNQRCYRHTYFFLFSFFLSNVEEVLVCSPTGLIYP